VRIKRIGLSDLLATGNSEVSPQHKQKICPHKERSILMSQKVKEIEKANYKDKGESERTREFSVGASETWVYRNSPSFFSESPTPNQLHRVFIRLEHLKAEKKVLLSILWIQ
jgi:hypothetical protein